MKLNKKGFMLAEVVISASVVAVVLVTMYIGINRMTAAYDKRSRYYDIDAQQVAMEINDVIEKSGKDDVFKSTSGLLMSRLINTRYPETVDLFNIYVDDLKYTSCNAFVVRDVNAFDVLLNSSNMNQSFANYLSYFVKKIDFSENYSYFVVVELKKNGGYYYYTLKVK